MTTFFDGPKPRLFAHWSASGEAPENTMAAFQRAVDAGVEYIELDVHASEDGQVMIIHDANSSTPTATTRRWKSYASRGVPWKRSLSARRHPPNHIDYFSDWMRHYWGNLSVTHSRVELRSGRRLRYQDLIAG